MNPLDKMTEIFTAIAVFCIILIGIGYLYVLANLGYAFIKTIISYIHDKYMIMVLTIIPKYDIILPSVSKPTTRENDDER